MALTRPKIWDLDTTIEYFNDPITVLHQGSTQANVDVGFLFNRANGLVSNVALYWNESSQSFVTAYTSSDGTTNTNVAVTSYANLTVGNVLMVNGSILNVTGNINVTGNLNYSNVTDLVVGDPLIYIGANNTGDLYDLGIVASYNDGTYYHTGLARNHTNGVWTIFDRVSAEPTTVIDWANATYPSFRAGNITSTDTITATTQVVAPDIQLPNSRLTGKALTLGAWIIQEDPNGGGSLFFKYNGTTVFSISSAGIVTAAQDITSYGTPA